jgi:hypothetical protein
MAARNVEGLQLAAGAQRGRQQQAGSEGPFELRRVDAAASRQVQPRPQVAVLQGCAPAARHLAAAQPLVHGQQRGERVPERGRRRRERQALLCGLHGGTHSALRARRGGNGAQARSRAAEDRGRRARE